MGKGRPSEIWKEIKPRLGDMITAANDMEQGFDKAVKEAYDKGLSDGKNQDAKDFADMYDSGYSEGLKDAWEVARKIASDKVGWNYSIFGQQFTVEILNTHSAQEALEEIRAHEQAQKELEESKKEQSVTAEEVMRQYLDTFCNHSKSCVECPLHTPDFTCGRGYHFICKNQVSDEEVRRAYAEVLQKMKEENNG